MKFIADLHIHSKYSRATSPKMVIEELAKWAKIKGITVLGTGDFTHPDWFKELQENLTPAEDGLFVFKNDKGENPTRFMLTAETSHIYSKNGKGRRVHLLIWAPSFEAVKKINTKLSWVGNLRSDGRPILGLDCKELLKIVLDADPSCVVIPAHAWTPWFSVFGSMSGFNSLEECFDELTPHIFAIETGLSSCPKMNWRLSKLDKIALVSNSDSHSLERIGREANVFDTDLSYKSIIKAVKNRDRDKFLFTIEFFPEEGKYHYDGHRACGVSFNPQETKKYNGICPKCGRPVTVGVMSRVEKLADRPQDYSPSDKIPFKNLVPLNEIIIDALGVNSKTKKVLEEYFNLCGSTNSPQRQKFGGELPLLLDGDVEEIAKVSSAKIAEGVKRVREGKLYIEPGYDGEYGKVNIFKKEEPIQKAIDSQKSLF